MRRIEDFALTVANLEASFGTIRNVVTGLAQRAAVAESERDAAKANAVAPEDVERFEALLDRLISLAHDAQAMTQG